MQTFLPYSDFHATARVLDNKRLGNQVYREANTLLGGGWQNHPAAKMWLGYGYALCDYCLALLDEMERRGNWKPEVVPRWRAYFLEKQTEHDNVGLPPWIGDERFHASHRSNLLRKDPEHYGQFGWTEPADLEYIWPQ